MAVKSLDAVALKDLLRQAREVAANAYAPYSKFTVGAALLLADGRTVVKGCNVENASYGLTICAERVAIGRAIADGQRAFLAVAVIAGDGTNPCSPCGACRQFIAEFGQDILVVMEGHDGEPLAEPIGDLLPHTFVLEGGHPG